VSLGEGVGRHCDWFGLLNSHYFPYKLLS
jgi:hypothetical protein